MDSYLFEVSRESKYKVLLDECKEAMEGELCATVPLTYTSMYGSNIFVSNVDDESAQKILKDLRALGYTASLVKKKIIQRDFNAQPHQLPFYATERLYVNISK